MQKTEHYQLNQWDRTDRILMEDFNGDNAKIDAALASKASTSALSDLQSVVSGKASTASLHALQTKVTAQGTQLSQRNCRFEIGSYTGNGTYGPANAITLTFSQKPVFVCVTSDGTGMQLNLAAGQKSTLISSSGGVSSLSVSWGSNSVSWHVENPSVIAVAPAHQMNAESTYHYFAILEL